MQRQKTEALPDEDNEEGSFAAPSDPQCSLQPNAYGFDRSMTQEREILRTENNGMCHKKKKREEDTFISKEF
uniref:Uncharacterized protein n=1 Tax=Coccidioides posadasii RMSCC 3488 TaxID=454284 RepID=A0A0J6EVQ0_COCPO|nr:hypothetical protein CPAG_00963 [Coccidioides posadasii RMSCC 3488]